jgi:hypothetical protein
MLNKNNFGEVAWPSKTVVSSVGDPDLRDPHVF